MIIKNIAIVKLHEDETTIYHTISVRQLLNQ